MYLETRGLTIRRMTDGDFPDWLRYATDAESCRMRGTEAYGTPEEAENAFEWLMNHEKRFYAIVLREEGRCVGHLLVYNFPSVSGEPELQGLTGRALSFCVAKEHWRQGIALEALSATIDYLFNHRGVDYISSGYFDFNAPSRALHEKLGFTPFSQSPVTLPGGGRATAIETILFNPAAPRQMEPRVSEK